MTRRTVEGARLAQQIPEEESVFRAQAAMFANCAIPIDQWTKDVANMKVAIAGMSVLPSDLERMALETGCRAQDSPAIQLKSLTVDSRKACIHIAQQSRLVEYQNKKLCEFDCSHLVMLSRLSSVQGTLQRS